jgi:hypothetical protein
MEVRSADVVNTLSQSMFLVGGVSGSTASFFKVDTSGSLFVTASSGLTVNQGLSGVLTSPWPVLLTSGDAAFGTVTNPLFVSTSFASPSSGALPPRLAIVGGYDFNGNKIRPIRVDENGFVIVKAEEQEPTFITVVSGVQLDMNKSMFSLYNSGTSSPVVLKIRKISIINVQTSQIGGTVANFEIRRITSHSAGTTINPQTLDTRNSLNSVVSAKTGGTVTGESADIITRYLWSAEEWSVGSSLAESQEHAQQTLVPAWNLQEFNLSPLTLRANEGFTIKQTVNTTAGSFDVVVIFSQEDF